MTTQTVDRFDAGWSIDLQGVQATQRLAKRLARELPWGAVVGLAGDLGAGKTSFVQGLARGLGVWDIKQVLSPTYTLMNEYPARDGTLVHIDFYRLQDEESARALGLEEAMGQQSTIVVVEWADHLAGLMPVDTVWIRLTAVGATQRRCDVTGLARPGTL